MEELEFELCEYLDGSLSEPDRAAVGAILASSAEARDLLESYRRLDAAFKLLPPTPAILWNRHAAHISDAIAETEKLEFAVSQFVDGTLGESERQEVEARLADDEDVRGLHTHHDQLTTALRSLQSGSQIHWDALTQRISASIDRIEFAPARSFKIFQWRSAIPLAAAASILIAVGVAVSVYLRSPAIQPISAHHTVALAPIVEVSGPAAQVAADPVADVQIGPARSVSADGLNSHYDDDVVSRPARVIIASSAKSDSDLIGLPY